MPACVHSAAVPRSPSRTLRKRSRRRLSAQSVLFCACGATDPTPSGVCRRCQRRLKHSRAFFGGFRELVLARDGYRCCGCGAGDRLHVHHRSPGVNHPELLVTLCPACHAQIHRLQALRKWMIDRLVSLWRELHPNAAMQLQFGWSGT